MDRPTAALEKMKDCLQHDSCGEWDCVYFANFKELQCVLAWVEELEAKTNTCSHLEGNYGQKATD